MRRRTPVLVRQKHATTSTIIETYNPGGLVSLGSVLGADLPAGSAADATAGAGW
jgi:hypothetical protein